MINNNLKHINKTINNHESLLYRKELDGLRGLILLYVTFAHAFNTIFPGDYVAMDCFFVLSGYLVFRTIYFEYNETNSIDLKRYFYKRIKRLLPTLLVVVYLTFGVGLLVFEPYYHSSLAAETLSSLYFYANYYFSNSIDYFSFYNGHRPLLHTWSLSFEEHFVSAIPFLILFFKKRIFIVAMGMAFVSYIFIQYENDLNRIYFQTPFRWFQFMFGVSIVFLESWIKSIKLKQIFAYLGFFLFILCVVIFDQTVIYRKYLVVLPSVFSALFILGGYESGLLKIVFSLSWLRYLGKACYSIYLIHFPVIVFSNYYFLENNNFLDKVLMFLFSIVLGLFIYETVEKKLRFVYIDRFVKNITHLVILIIGSIVPLSIFLLLVKFNSIHIKDASIIPYSEIRESDLNLKGLGKDMCTFEDRRLDGKGECNTEYLTKVLVLGNSHEFYGYYLLKNILSPDYRIDYSSSFSVDNTLCDFKFVNDQFISKESNCKNVEQKLNDRDYIRKTYKYIVLSFHAVDRENGIHFLGYLKHLQKYSPDLKVVIIGSLFDYGKNKCLDLINRFGLEACNNPSFISYFNTSENQFVFDTLGEHNVFYFDRVPLFCKKRDIINCSVIFEKRPIIFDSNHLNFLGIKKQVELLKENKGMRSQLLEIFNK